jgi:hypothetical protein
MKRSLLMIFALFAVLLAGPAFADEPADLLDEAALETTPAAAANADAEATSALVCPQADFEAEIGSSMGTVTCLCTCASYIWSLEDVYTNGTCEELVGQTCYNNWGQGTYIECRQDGGGFPF